MTDEERTASIREQNDYFRKTGFGGRVVAAGAFAQANEVTKLLAVNRVQNHDGFDEGSDPHGEHDFGSFTMLEQRYFWKIDYYDLRMENGSEDPSDPTQTVRLLTIFYAEDY